jgi:hypothetical protein
MEISGARINHWAKELGPFNADAHQFARMLGGRSRDSSRLFVVGTPEFEPWHFVAHLGEQAARHGRADLVPTLLRWKVPPSAPPHLAVGVDAMANATGRHTFLVVSEFSDTPELLERVSDAKGHGARIMSLHRGQPELVDLSHETLSVDRSKGTHMFDVTQHVVTNSAPLKVEMRSPRWRRSLRSG